MAEYRKWSNQITPLVRWVSSRTTRCQSGRPKWSRYSSSPLGKFPHYEVPKWQTKVVKLNNPSSPLGKFPHYEVPKWQAEVVALSL